MKLRTMLLAVAASALAARFTPFGVDALDPNEVVPTVEIKSGKGTARINASDYRADVHELANPDEAESVLNPTPAVAGGDPAFAAPASPPAAGTDTAPAPGAASPTLPPVGSAGLPPAATANAAPSVPGTSAEQNATNTSGPTITKFGSGKTAKFFVTDNAGTKLDGFSGEGYATVDEAQAAVTAATIAPAAAQ